MTKEQRDALENCTCPEHAERLEVKFFAQSAPLEEVAIRQASLIRERAALAAGTERLREALEVNHARENQVNELIARCTEGFEYQAEQMAKGER